MCHWEKFCAEEKEKSYLKKLIQFVDQAYRVTTVYPPRGEIFAALKATPYEKTRVVILGQDPYHGANQAHGLSFSVASAEAKVPPSLRNIFKELESDVGVQRINPNLMDWAGQGVLLLNTTLTVEGGKAGSHRGKGWEIFTDSLIERLNQREEPILFVLWGADARSKRSLITNSQHEKIESVHPSPLSAHRGFCGSKPFSQINSWLRENNYLEIEW